MPDLEQQLRALSTRVDWPATPDLATQVTERLTSGRPTSDLPGRSARRPEGGGRLGGRMVGRPPATRPRPRRIAIALALALMIPAGAAFGDDLLEWLGVKGAEVRRVEKLPPAEPPALADLGERTTLAEAERRAGFDVAVPADLGPPPEVRFDDVNRSVTLVYDPRGEPLIVAQAPGALIRDVIRKLVATSSVREVRVGRGAGLYISGVPHAVLLRRPGGGFAEDRARLAGDTLLFNRGELVVRIESERLPLARALAIARSLR
ncbi:MAG TPA: hypothetical protein VHF89_13605 [Solirubrobacteraceae bacterium]|nr:hypothetical protein [Solirubrobacteraceae bacterium]